MQKPLSLLAAAALVLATGCEDGHDHVGTDTTDATDTTATGDSDAADYCGCMLANCHDAYHGTWGEDHLQSEMACSTDAQALPKAGMDVNEGDFIECRLHYCEIAQSSNTADDPVNCPKAIGGDVCM